MNLPVPGVQPSQRPPDLKERLQTNRELWLLFAGLTALYAVLVTLGNRRYVWYDELFTFDIARASTIPRLWQMLRLFDCSPPTSYLLSRFSMGLLGQNSWGLRLPSMIEFYLGSAAVFLYVRRRVGAPFAAFAVLLIWASGQLYYAVEARPYALLFMSCAFLLLFWDTATRSENRTLALWGVALSSLGMFSAHALAPFSLFPFLVAEAARFWRRRRPDYALWAALLVPTAAMVSYIPLFQTYKLILFPKAFQASPWRLAGSFYGSVGAVSLAALAAWAAALLVLPARERKMEISGHRRGYLVLLSGFVLGPVLLTLILLSRHEALWDKDNFATIFALYSTFTSAFAISLALLFAAVAALAAAPLGESKRESSDLRVEDFVLFLGFVMSSVLVTLFLMHRHAGFWDRYIITSEAALYPAFAIWLGRRFALNRHAGYVASLVVLYLVVQLNVVSQLHHSRPANEEALISVRPDLPLVDASYLTFFEMNHYESGPLLSRLYYLRDRAAAIQYAHASTFEGFQSPDRMKPWFPIPAHSDEYLDFVRRHHQFLVFGTDGYPEDWLLPKLQADGAHLSKLGTYPGFYKDSTLYLVTMPPGR